VNRLLLQITSEHNIRPQVLYKSN